MRCGVFVCAVIIFISSICLSEPPPPEIKIAKDIPSTREALLEKIKKDISRYEVLVGDLARAADRNEILSIMDELFSIREEIFLELWRAIHRKDLGIKKEDLEKVLEVSYEGIPFHRSRFARTEAIRLDDLVDVFLEKDFGGEDVWNFPVEPSPGEKIPNFVSAHIILQRLVEASREMRAEGRDPDILEVAASALMRRIGHAEYYIKFKGAGNRKLALVSGSTGKELLKLIRMDRLYRRFIREVRFPVSRRVPYLSLYFRRGIPLWAAERPEAMPRWDKYVERARTKGFVLK